jgi:hypothetical protein
MLQGKLYIFTGLVHLGRDTDIEIFWRELKKGVRESEFEVGVVIVIFSGQGRTNIHLTD